MAAGTTALHVLGDTFRELAEKATGGAVTVRVFPSGTLGQEREVVQQLQEGLVDFMVSGTAIWGSVAPKLQVFDFPFMWRDWAHVHGVVDGRVGREAAEYVEGAVRDACPASVGPPRDTRGRGARGREAPARHGPARGYGGDGAADEERHDHPRHRQPRLAAGGRAALGRRGARKWHDVVARGHS